MAHNFIADKATLDAVKVDTTDIRTVVNAIPTGGRAVFTSNGTFTVPAGITEIVISACAAGGTGGTGGTGGSNYSGTGGAGGYAGQYIYGNKYAVTPNANLSITVGAGNTIIGTLVTLIAGAGPRGSGGGPSTVAYIGGPGGAGGSSAFGAGGGAGAPASTTGGAGGGYGAGGGGGGGGNSGGNLGGTGGAGAPGIVIIEW